MEQNKPTSCQPISYHTPHSATRNPKTPHFPQKTLPHTTTANHSQTSTSTATTQPHPLTEYPHKHQTTLTRKRKSQKLLTHVTQPRRATRLNALRARNDVRKLSATCCSKRLPTRISIRQNFHPPGGIPTSLNVYPPDSGRNLQQRSSATYSSATWFRHLLRHLDL